MEGISTSCNAERTDSSSDLPPLHTRVTDWRSASSLVATRRRWQSLHCKKPSRNSALQSGQYIGSRWRRAFHNLPDNLPRQHLLFRRNVNRCFLPVLLDAHRNFVLFQCLAHKIDALLIVARPDGDCSVAQMRGLRGHRSRRSLVFRRKLHIHRLFIQKPLANLLRFRQIRRVNGYVESEHWILPDKKWVGRGSISVVANGSVNKINSRRLQLF